MAATQTYLWAWPPPSPSADWSHALARHRSPVQFPLEWSGQLLVKLRKPVTATVSSYNLLAACSVDLYSNGRAVRIRPKACWPVQNVAITQPMPRSPEQIDESAQTHADSAFAQRS